MHSIKNISERNKIDTQSRADTYIRRKRLISKSRGGQRYFFWGCAFARMLPFFYTSASARSQ